MKTKTKKEADHAKKSGGKRKAKIAEPQEITQKQLKRFDELETVSVSAVTLGKIVDLTAQGIQLKAKEGKLKRNEDKTFPLVASVLALFQELRQNGAARGGRPRDEGTSEADYWRAAKLREQTQEGRRQIAEEIMDAILRTWRAIGEKWLDACRPESREDIKKLFADFESVAGSISIDDTTTAMDDDEDEREDENGETA